jgi:hypothetical protein
MGWLARVSQSPKKIRMGSAFGPPQDVSPRHPFASLDQRWHRHCKEGSIIQTLYQRKTGTAVDA